MIVKTPGKIHLEHIMWQPTFSCHHKCKNCYVGKAPQKHLQAPADPQIFSLIFMQKRVKCDQLTISLDATIHPSEDLICILEHIWQRYKTETDLPSLSITLRDQNSLATWAQTLGKSVVEFLKPIDSLSLSNMPSLGKLCEDLQYICKQSKTTLIYNKMIKQKTPGTKAFELGVRYSDFTHLVFKKEPLGDMPDPHDLEAWFKAKEEVPTEKLKQDLCLQECIRHRTKGWTCSAGISRVHVWPDGSVTGCPYDSYQKLRQGEVKDTWHELLDVTENRTSHSIEFCKISEVIDTRLTAF